MSGPDREKQPSNPASKAKPKPRLRSQNRGRSHADGLTPTKQTQPQRPTKSPAKKSDALSRRHFLKSTAIGAAGLMAAPRILSPNSANASPRGATVVRAFHSGATTSPNLVNQDPVSQMVHASIRELTGIGDTGEAWKSLFPGITADKTISIKINLACGDVPTRPEVINAVIEGLLMMDLGGEQLPANHIIVWDHETGFMCTQTGYSVNYGGSEVQYYGTDYSGVGFDYSKSYDIVHSNTTTHHYVSKIISQRSDYIINAAVMKDHDDWACVTLCLKNYYGSFSGIYDTNMHYNNFASGLPGLSMILRDQLGDKVKLNLIDALYCLCDGGPGYTPPGHTPPNWVYNSVLASQDPVAIDRIGTILINQERVSRGLSVLDPAYLPAAAGDPYYLGTEDPAQIALVELDVETQAVDDNPAPSQLVNLKTPYPNPMRHNCTLAFTCASASNINMVITDLSGRIISRIADARFPAGPAQFAWNGRDERGRLVPSGTYFCRLDNSGQIQQQPLIVIR